MKNLPKNNLVSIYLIAVFLLILSLFVPQLAGLSGVWWSYCGAQILSGAAAALLLLLERLRRQR